MSKVKGSVKSKVVIALISVLLLSVSGYFIYTYLQKNDEISSSDSEAGVLNTCFSNVASLGTSLSCGGGKFKSASYRCAGGYAGKVGDGVTCRTTSQLRRLAEGACVKYANCRMFVPAYSEVFSSTTFSENNIALVNTAASRKHSLNSNGLNLNLTKLTTAAQWHEARLIDQNVNEDLVYEVKGVKVSLVNNAESVIALRGFSPSTTVTWNTLGGPSNWNAMELKHKVINGKRYVTGYTKADGVNAVSLQNSIPLPAGVTSVDFKIVNMNGNIIGYYNAGSGYVEILKLTSTTWKNKYMIMATYAPINTDVTGSFKSVKYDNLTGRFALKSKYYEKFTKSSFNNTNWTVFETNSAFKYGFSTKGLVLNLAPASTIINARIRFDSDYRKLNLSKNDFRVVATDVALDSSSANESWAHINLRSIFNNTTTNTTTTGAYYGVVKKSGGIYTVESFYTKDESKPFVLGKSIKLPSGVTKATFRLTKTSTRLKIDVNYGSGYKNLLLVNDYNPITVYSEFGLTNRNKNKAVGSIGSYQFFAR